MLYWHQSQQKVIDKKGKEKQKSSFTHVLFRLNSLEKNLDTEASR